MDNMESKFLSADELMELRKRTDKTVGFLHSQGEKSFSPCGSWLEEKQLDCFLKDMRDTIKEERLSRIGDLSLGEWKPDIRKVVLQKEKGKAIQYLGERINKKKYLNPEEAIFLLETAAIEIFYCGTPISIQQAYALFLTSGKEMETYYAYSHLSRLGFTIVKHQGRINIVEDQTSGPVKNPEIQNKISDQNLTTVNEMKNSQPATTHTCEIKTRNQIEKLIRSSLPVNTDGDKNLDIKVKSAIKIKKVIDFPNFASSDTITLEPPPKYLMPNNVAPQKSSYKISLYKETDKSIPKGNSKTYEIYPRKRRKYMNSRGSSHESTNKYKCQDSDNSIKKPTSNDKETLVEAVCHKQSLNKDPNYVDDEKLKKRIQTFSHTLHEYPSLVPKLNDKSLTNWTDFKRAIHMEKQNPECTEGFILWSGKTQPLIKMNELLTIEEVQTRLQIIPEINYLDDLSIERTTTENILEINYDVYLPGIIYRRSKPSLPKIRICVLNCREAVPTLGEVETLQKDLNDQIPLYFAIVSDSGEVAFYGFNHISVPRYVPLRDIPLLVQ